MVSVREQAAALAPARVAVMAPAKVATLVAATAREGGGGPGGGGGGTDYDKIFSGREVTSKARVLSKPEPTYTEAARKNQITGTVVLRAVFSSGGSVTNIHAVSGLPDGLTERAIAAAKSIKFVPATKDGHPVSCGWSCSTTSICTNRCAGILPASPDLQTRKRRAMARLFFFGVRQLGFVLADFGFLR